MEHQEIERVEARNRRLRGARDGGALLEAQAALLPLLLLAGSAAAQTGVPPADLANRQLADPRLEALRRFVGLVRSGDREAQAAAAMLAACGVGASAIELLRAFATR